MAHPEDISDEEMKSLFAQAILGGATPDQLLEVILSSLQSPEIGLSAQQKLTLRGVIAQKREEFEL